MHYPQKPPTLNLGKKPEIAKNEENRPIQAVYGALKAKNSKKKSKFQKFRKSPKFQKYSCEMNFRVKILSIDSKSNFSEVGTVSNLIHKKAPRGSGKP